MKRSVMYGKGRGSGVEKEGDLEERGGGVGEN